MKAKPATRRRVEHRPRLFDRQILWLLLFGTLAIGGFVLLLFGLLMR